MAGGTGGGVEGVSGALIIDPLEKESVMSQVVTVLTKKELERAIEDGATEIIAVGDLAKDLHNGKRITTLSKVALVGLVIAIGAAPFTAGGSAAVAGAGMVSAFSAGAGVAGTGLSATAIAAIVSIGIILIVKLFEKYDEVDFEIDAETKTARVKLRRKQ
jgi:hypothetical protein